MCNLINTYIHTYIVSLIPPREDQCEWHRMTRMTGPDCVVMCNLINTYIHTYHIQIYILFNTGTRCSPTTTTINFRGKSLFQMTNE